MKDNSTPTLRDNVSPLYREGDTIIFKYEGNVRARVTGCRVIDGKVWLEAYAAFMSFLVPAAQVVGIEPEEEG
jgi:hypothetical protein